MIFFKSVSDNWICFLLRVAGRNHVGKCTIMFWSWQHFCQIDVQFIFERKMYIFCVYCVCTYSLLTTLHDVINEWEKKCVLY